MPILGFYDSLPSCFPISIHRTENLPLYTECASHGVCNKLDGVCKCNLGTFEIPYIYVYIYIYIYSDSVLDYPLTCMILGFYGPACTDTTDSKDRHAFTHDGPFLHILPSPGGRHHLDPLGIVCGETCEDDDPHETKDLRGSGAHHGRKEKGEDPEAHKTKKSHGTKRAHRP